MEIILREYLRELLTNLYKTGSTITVRVIPAEWELFWGNIWENYWQIYTRQVDNDEMQFGFMTACGTTNVIFILGQLQQKYLLKKRNLHFAFADLELGVLYGRLWGNYV